MINMEGICYNPEERPKAKYGAAVKYWLRDIPRPPKMARMINYEVV